MLADWRLDCIIGKFMFLSPVNKQAVCLLYVIRFVVSENSNYTLAQVGQLCQFVNDCHIFKV